MPSLIDQLARRLDAPPERARERLQTLLAALRSRIERTGEASLPGLGTFSRAEGTWAFEPEADLSRTVNRSFEGLDPVGAPAGPHAESEETEDPSQDIASEDVAPDDTAGEDANAAEEEAAPLPAVGQSSIFDTQGDNSNKGKAPAPRGVFDPAGIEPPTEEDLPPEEEKAPSGAEASSEGELFSSLSNVPLERDRTEAPPSSEAPPPASQNAPPEQQAADAPSLANASASEQPNDSPPPPSSPPAEKESPAPRNAPAWSYAALPAGYLVRRRTASPSPQDLRTSQLRPPGDVPLPNPASAARRDEAPRAADRPAAPSSPGADASSPPGEQRPEPTPAAERGGGDGGAGLVGWLAALAVVIALGLGAWYFLSQQQGTSPGPATAAQQDEAPAREAGDAASASNAASAPVDSSEAAAPDTSASSLAPTPGERAYARAGRLERTQGGWTVVVASETSREEARRTAQQFAQQFQEQGYPIDILEATVNGTIRYRVAVGQFGSREAAAGILQQGSNRFPQGAWSLEIPPRS